MKADEAEQWVDRLLGEVRGELVSTVREHLRRGRPPSDRPVSELARMMAAAVPKASAWNEAIGPFYDTAGVRRLLRVTRQALAQQRAAHRILALTTADGQIAYPAFQFDDRRRVLPGLASVLAAVPDDVVDGWTLAAWLYRSELGELKGRTVIDHLRGVGDPAAAEAAARRMAARWAA